MMALILSLVISTHAPALQNPTWIGKPGKAPFKRIVSLAPSVTELLFAMQQGSHVVGVTRYCSYPPAATKIRRIGDFAQPDIETIVSLKPDLVIAIPTRGNRRPVETLARFGIPTLVLTSENLNDLWHSIDMLGRALQRQHQATTLKNALQRQLRQLLQQAQQRGNAKKALLLLGHHPWIGAGKSSFLAQLLPYVGLRSVLQGHSAYPTLDLEAIAQMKPDVIIDLSMTSTSKSTATSVLSHFAKRHHITLVPWYDEALIRPGPRLPEALLRLRQHLDKVLGHAPTP